MNVIVIREPILLARYFDKTAVFGWFYNTFIAFTTSNPLVYSSKPKILLAVNWQNL